VRVRWFSLFAFAAILLLLVISIQGLDTQAQHPTQKGIAHTDSWDIKYSHPDADLSLASLASTGADWISVHPVGYQNYITSTTIFTTTQTATDADLLHVITVAHDMGLKVMLKPQLGVLLDPSEGAGSIGEQFTTEIEWNAWFASYQDFIFHYADVAEPYGADQFCVGTELAATTHRADDWREVIAGVRLRFDGPITYASFGGKEVDISWWDAVDYIGVDAYYPLTDKLDPTLEELRAAWIPHIATLTDLAVTWGKPIIFTEIGYRSMDGANIFPGVYWSGGTIDLQEQADCYQAAFESVYDQPWFAGMFWWAWDAEPFAGGVCDDGYIPHDKPAEDVLRDWYGGPPRRQILPKPDYGRTMDIYTDDLSLGWEDSSWWCVTCDFAATDQVYSGTHAISVTLQPHGALSLYRDPAFDASPYYWLEFYVRGSSLGEHHLWAFFYSEGGTELRKRPVDDCRYVEEGTIEAGTWKQVLIPLSDLNAGEEPLVQLSIQGSEAPTAFWIDEIRLIGAAWQVYLPAVLRN
jgi:hypothetical protein